MTCLTHLKHEYRFRCTGTLIFFIGFHGLLGWILAVPWVHSWNKWLEGEDNDSKQLKALARFSENKDDKVSEANTPLEKIQELLKEAIEADGKIGRSSRHGILAQADMRRFHKTKTASSPRQMPKSGGHHASAAAASPLTSNPAFMMPMTSGLQLRDDQIDPDEEFEGAGQYGFGLPGQVGYADHENMDNSTVAAGSHRLYQQLAQDMRKMQQKQDDMSQSLLQIKELLRQSIQQQSMAASASSSGTAGVNVTSSVS